MRKVNNMILKIEFRTDSSDFDWNVIMETSSTLRKVADKIDVGAVKGDIRDTNGTVIGQYELTG